MQQKKDKIQKILFWLSYLFRFIILIEAVSAAWQKDLLTLSASLGILILTFMPSLLKKNYKITLPTEMEFLLVLFISLSLVLGELRGFYAVFWWWDIFLHSFSAILLAFVGLLIPYILYTEKRIKTTPKFVALFMFTFALAIGASWEIFEFGMDQIFGFNMQKSGLVDTMWDLITDAISAFILSIITYFYLKRKNKIPIIEKLIEKFMNINSHLSRRR